MKHLVESNTYHSHLLHIETLVQSESDVEFGYVESERVLLHSLEEVRDEVHRRYRNTIQEPLYVDSGTGDSGTGDSGTGDSGTGDDPQVGWVYRYEAEVGREHDFKMLPYRDFVRVYLLQGETVDPNQWRLAPRIKQSHLEEELADTLQRLLDSTELNLDNMEPETREAINHARQVLAAREPKQ